MGFLVVIVIAAIIGITVGTLGRRETVQNRAAILQVTPTPPVLKDGPSCSFAACIAKGGYYEPYPRTFPGACTLTSASFSKIAVCRSGYQLACTNGVYSTDPDGCTYWFCCVPAVTISVTPTPTTTGTPSITPTPTNSLTPSASPTPTPTPITTETPTPTPTPRPTITPSPTPTQTPSPTQTHTPTPSPTKTPTSTPTHTPSPTPTRMPTPTPTTPTSETIPTPTDEALTPTPSTALMASPTPTNFIIGCPACTSPITLPDPANPVDASCDASCDFNIDNFPAACPQAGDAVSIKVITNRQDWDGKKYCANFDDDFDGGGLCDRTGNLQANNFVPVAPPFTYNDAGVYDVSVTCNFDDATQKGSKTCRKRLSISCPRPETPTPSPTVAIPTPTVSDSCPNVTVDFAMINPISSSYITSSSCSESRFRCSTNGQLPSNISLAVYDDADTIIQRANPGANELIFSGTSSKIYTCKIELQKSDGTTQLCDFLSGRRVCVANQSGSTVGQTNPTQGVNTCPDDKIDLNNDRYLNMLDYSIFVQLYSGVNKDIELGRGDFNCDGAVSLLDFEKLRSHFDTEVK